jgi:DNA-binding transcriptional MerR regulator/mannose-6-phosphate isomerase-like protein (cupin superfamily)
MAKNKTPSFRKDPPPAVPTGDALKIGEVAQALGISASMIRAWEKLGLIRPGRTDSAYRLYSQEDVHILRRAVYLRRVNGLNAPAILNQLRQEGLLPRTNNGGSAEMHIGPRLRKLRLQRGESLATVAKTLNISIGFLSNLERSQSGASVGITHKLAQYYGANILELFNSPAADGPLVREDGRKVLQGGAGVRMELLAWGQISMEPHLFRVAAGAGSVESYSHEGEEFLFITKGRLNIFLEGQEYQLRAGDSFYFQSSSPHRWENPGKTEAVILWVNTPPTF